MARAVYSRSDVVVLDDPLSALDAHVARHVFDACILGLLGGKTVILVTHNLQVLRRVNSIMVFRDGRVVQQGSYERLAAERDGEFQQMYVSWLRGGGPPQVSTAAIAGGGSSMSQHAKCASRSEADGAPGECGKQLGEGAEPRLFTEEEEREIGTVRLRTYRAYLATSCPALLCAAIGILFAVAQSVRVFADYWLVLWRSDAFGWSVAPYVATYAGISLAAGCLLLARNLFLAATLLSSSKRLHANMMARLPYAPMHFFHAQPIGRIMNRVSKDQNIVDEDLQESLADFTNCLTQVVCSFGLACLALPWFAVALLPAIFAYARIRRYYNASSRELKRLDSISRSPLVSHFYETIAGLQTIRAFDKVAAYSSSNVGHIEENQRAVFCLLSSNRWLAVRLENLGTALIAVVALLGVIQGRHPALVGIALAYVMNCSQELNWTVRSSSQVETQMTSVERLLSYSDIPQEAPQVIESTEPGGDWPAAGAIQILDLCLCYGNGRPPALDGVSLDIPAGVKLGIVGRTGAGKTSILNVLLRLVEPTAGAVLIDGVDCSKLGLKTLREVFGYMPQDPVLLSGALRYNLDPAHAHTDEAVWAALRAVQLEAFVESTGRQLQLQVAANGENLSLGQRQLLCLARALLQRPRILLMDEATSSVDAQADSAVQQELASGAFRSTTQLIVAHRLGTVSNVDLVCVLDSGRVAELGPPAELLRSPSSMYAQLLHASAAAGGGHRRPSICVPADDGFCVIGAKA